MELQIVSNPCFQFCSLITLRKLATIILIINCCTFVFFSFAVEVERFLLIVYQ